MEGAAGLTRLPTGGLGITALLLKVMIGRRLNLPQTGRFLCGTLGTTALPFWPALRTDSLVILHGHQRFVALPVDQLYAHRCMKKIQFAMAALVTTCLAAAP